MKKAKERKTEYQQEALQKKSEKLMKSVRRRMPFRSDNLRREFNLLEYETKEIAKTAVALVSFGVTEEQIRALWQPRRFALNRRSFFDGFDRETLVFLISGQPPAPHPTGRDLTVVLPESMRLTPEAAFEQINGLNHTQLNALMWLYSYGLRANHLRNWQSDDISNEFQLGHCNALKALVIGGRNVETAIHLLQGKSENEAWSLWCSIIQRESSTPSISGSQTTTVHPATLHPHENAKKLEEIIKNSLAADEKDHNAFKIPDEFICPISGKIMDNPVNIPGEPHAFERDYLMRWFEIKKTNPMTNLVIDPKTVTRNESLETKIDSFIHRYKDKCEAKQGFLTAFWKRQKIDTSIQTEMNHSEVLNANSKKI